MAGARDSALLPRTAACPQDFRSARRPLLLGQKPRQPAYLPACLPVFCVYSLSVGMHVCLVNVSQHLLIICQSFQSAHRHLLFTRMSRLFKVFPHPSCSLSFLSLVLALSDYTSRLTIFLTNFLYFFPLHFTVFIFVSTPQPVSVCPYLPSLALLFATSRSSCPSVCPPAHRSQSPQGRGRVKGHS